MTRPNNFRVIFLYFPHARVTYVCVVWLPTFVVAMHSMANNHGGDLCCENSATLQRALLPDLCLDNGSSAPGGGPVVRIICQW